MEPLVLAAIIAGSASIATVLLTMFGKMVKYIVGEILSAYKGQATATLEAKDRDLAAKDKLIGKLEGRVQKLDERNTELLSIVSSQQKMLETRE